MTVGSSVVSGTSCSRLYRSTGSVRGGTGDHDRVDRRSADDRGVHRHLDRGKNAESVMTETPAYPGYATPTVTYEGGTWWVVIAQPWDRIVGRMQDAGPVGWTARTARGAYVGLFPTQQAAGEALVRHAGYEVLG